MTPIAAAGMPSKLQARNAQLDQFDWAALLARVQRDRLAGHLPGAVSSGIIRATEAQRAEIADLDHTWQSHALTMEHLLLRVLPVLDAADVDCRVIKGTALAHTVYDDPAHRVFGDIDILVRGAHLALARRTLVAELGSVDALPEVRSGFDAEFAKDVLIRIDGNEVDLHRTLASGPFGSRIPVAELFESPATFELGGQQIKTLPPVATLLQVSYNAALGDIPPRLSSLRDVAQVYYVVQPPLAEVLELAERWGGTAVLARAVNLSWDTLALEPSELSEWAEGYEPGPLDRRLLAASTSESRSYTRALASLAAINGVRAKGRYARAILFPSPEYLEARGWTRGSHVKRALRRLRPTRR